MICGSLMCDFDTILNWASLMSNAQTSFNLTRRVLAACSKDPTLEPLQQVGWRNLVSRLLMVFYAKRDIANGGTTDFVSVLTMSCDCNATDPRDKIYGMLAITSEFSSNNKMIIKPDYTGSVRDIYVEATSVVLHRRNDLAPLMFTQDQSMKKNEDLPSWCPDYSVSINPSLRHLRDATRRAWQLGVPWSHESKAEVHRKSILAVEGSPSLATIKLPRQQNLIIALHSLKQVITYLPFLGWL